MTEKEAKGVKIITGTISLGLLIAFILFSVSLIKILTSYEKTKGNLIDYTERINEDEGAVSYSYAPIYSYEDYKGKSHTVSTFEFQKNRASLSKNATIYYDREFPENAVLGLFVFIIPFIILFFLIICVIVTFKM